MVIIEKIASKKRHTDGPTPTGLAEIVGDYFPVLHWRGGFCWPPAIRK